MFKKKPFFIVFEGVEGCGKSYQSKKLFNKLKKHKIKTILTREPGGTKSSELIRNLILKDYFNKKTKDKFDKMSDEDVEREYIHRINKTSVGDLVAAS